MEFRNTLYMSILLVGSFICLHFYEESVMDEFSAHNAMLKEVIDDQKSSFDALPYLINQNIAKSKEDVLKLNLWKREVKNLESLVAKSGKKNLSTSKHLFAKYDVDKDFLMYNGEISYLTQYKILNGILDQSDQVIEKLQKREYKNRENEIHIIINNRQNNYSKNEVYELELEVVRHYNNMENVEFFVEINGQKNIVHSFPFLLPKNANTGFIIGDFENPATGVKRTIKKIFFP